MKTIRIIYFLFSLLIFNVSCAQNYEWKKLDDGLYINELNSSKGKLLNQNDSITIEMYMFHPDDEIDLKKSINGEPLSYKIIYSSLNDTFNYERSLKLKVNSEYLIKKYNAKEIPKYSLKVNDISEEKFKEIFVNIKKNYGVNFTQTISNENSKKETIISMVDIQPNMTIDVEKLKQEFKNEIIDIQILKSNSLIYIYKIKS